MQPGDLFAMSDDVILADSVETIIAAGFTLGEDGVQPMILLKIEGKRNNHPDRAVTEIAVSPEVAFALQGSLLSGLETLMGIEPGGEQ